MRCPLHTLHGAENYSSAQGKIFYEYIQNISTAMCQVPQIFTKNVNPINDSVLFPPQIELEMMSDRDEFEIIDLSCNVFFTVEFLTRNCSSHV